MCGYLQAARFGCFLFFFAPFLFPLTAACDEIGISKIQSDFNNLIKDYGIDPELTVINDTVWNTRGGVRSGIVNLGQADLAVSLDTEKSLGLPGGTLYLDLFVLYGGHPTDYLGDVQGSDNIEAQTSAKIYELWYEQSFLSSHSAVLFGYHDYNTDFYSVNFGQSLINPSFGIGADVVQANPPNFPTTSLAIRAKVRPTERSYMLGGVYNGIPGDPSDQTGTDLNFNRHNGAFWAAEAGVISAESDPPDQYYKAGIGGWYFDGDFEDYAGSRHNSNGGLYGVLENTLYSEPEDPSQLLGYFLQIGLAQQRPNQFGRYCGFGLSYTGIVPGRDRDVTSAGLAYAKNSQDYSAEYPALDDYAVVYELTYQIALNEFLKVQPDLMWIHNPQNDPALDDAFALIVRIEAAM